MKIENFDLDKEVLVVAEIGNNHEGDFELAKKMIVLAAGAGADAVKFQTMVPERLVAPTETAKIAQLRKFQLSYQQFEELAKVAANEGVMFLSTPFDIESAKFLNKIVPAFKIASCDNNFFALLETVAATGKPIILSSGMSELATVDLARKCIEKVWHEMSLSTNNLAVLHCVAAYPTAPEQANLAAIPQLAKLGITVGYSDHTLGWDAAVLSVALGARIIEKHFTIDKNFSEFRDHQLSSEPAELKELVKRVKLASLMLGDGEKRLQDVEKETAARARRSIVAKNDMQKGAVITAANLDWLRPGTGMSPGREAEVIGKKLTRDIKGGEQLTLDDVA